MLARRQAAERSQQAPPSLPPGRLAEDLELDLGGRLYRVRGIPCNWIEQLSSRLLARRAEPGMPVHRDVEVALSCRDELRAPDGPHDLNETSELIFREHAVTYRSDWCEGQFARSEGEAARLVCHKASGPWFGAVIENMLRVLVAYDALEVGGVVMHSAALVREGDAVVLFGHSGAGKSTTSALALAQGCAVVSDDINLLEPRDGGWWVVPVPFSGSLSVTSTVDRPVPLRGLFHLNKAGADRCEPCSAAQAVSLLSGSAPFVNQDAYAAEDLLAVLTRLAVNLPVRELHFTRGPAFLDLVFGGAA